MTITIAFTIFTAALFMAFSHCTAMCGGIVVAYSRGKMGGLGAITQFFMHFLYNAGRIVTYAFLGVLAGFLGAQILKINGGIFFICLGFFLIFWAFSYAFFPGIVSRFEPNIRRLPGFSRAFSYFLRSKNPSSFFALGILNGFLPCGMTYFFALNALSFGNPADAALSMVIFGAATAVPLMAIGHFFSIFSRIRSRFFAYFSATLMIFLGSWHIFTGFSAVFGNENHSHHHELNLSPQPSNSHHHHHHH